MLKLPWSKEEDETLTNLWPTWSANEIAKLIGRSKNAIIGRANRLDLKPKRLVEMRKVYERVAERRYGPRDPLKRPGKPFVFKSSLPDRKPPQYVPPTQPWAGEGVPFLESVYGQCRAIMGSSDDPAGLAIVCGRPIKEGSAFSFCEEHHRKYTQKPFWGRS